MRRSIVVFSSVLLLLMLAVGVSVSASPEAQSGQTTYTVVYGDTLFRISLRFNTTIQALASANNISNVNLIFAGQTLTIPAPGGGTGTPPPTGVPSNYTVVPGDTLGALARRFGTTIQAIASANNISNINLIFVGQRLTIPGGTGGTPPPTGGTPPPTGGTPIPPPPGGFALGGQVFSFSYPDQMRGAGMTWAKSQVRYNQGDSPSIAQGAISAADNRGFNSLLSIVGNPAQLAANPTQYYQDFANFLGGVARLNPDAIEVWNEMNIDREWPTGQIDPADYVDMLSWAHGAIKNVDPEIMVITGALAPTGAEGAFGLGAVWNDDRYYLGMANAGVAEYADCIGVHYNEGIIPPSQQGGDPRDNYPTRYFPLMIQRAEFPFRASGLPLCFTELGYLSPEGLGPLPGGFAWGANTSVQEQATWLRDAVQIAGDSPSAIEMIIVFNMNGERYDADPQAGYAIIRADGTCPACQTIATLRQPGGSIG